MEMTNAERMNQLEYELGLKYEELLKELIDHVESVQEDMAAGAREYTELGRSQPELEVYLCVSVNDDITEIWVRTEPQTYSPDYIASGLITLKTNPVTLLNRLIRGIAVDALSDMDEAA